MPHGLNYAVNRPLLAGSRKKPAAGGRYFITGDSSGHILIRPHRRRGPISQISRPAKPRLPYVSGVVFPFLRNYIISLLNKKPLKVTPLKGFPPPAKSQPVKVSRGCFSVILADLKIDDLRRFLFCARKVTTGQRFRRLYVPRLFYVSEGEGLKT